MFINEDVLLKVCVELKYDFQKRRRVWDKRLFLQKSEGWISTPQFDVETHQSQIVRDIRGLYIYF